MGSLLRKKQLQPSLFFNNSDTSYIDYTYSGNFLTSIITWTDSGMTQKLHEELFTYSGGKVATITLKQYDRTSGTLLETETNTYTYSGNNIDFNDRVLT